MAPFPDNATVKIFLDYTVGDDAHVMLMRAAPGFAELNWLSQRDALYNLLLGISFSDVEYLAERIQFPGQNFTVPYRTIGLTGQLPGASTGASQPFQVTWQGRDPVGRRARLSVFGLGGISATENWRIETTENAIVQDVLDVLTATPGEFVSITAGQPVWLPYASATFNRRQIRRQRA